MTPGAPVPPGLPMMVMIALFFVAGLGAWVALDARDRGATRFHCMMWFFAILMFTPTVLLYLVVRAAENKAGIRRNPPADTPRPTAASACPYCGAEITPLSRLCPKCGKLL